MQLLKVEAEEEQEMVSLKVSLEQRQPAQVWFMFHRPVTFVPAELLPRPGWWRSPEEQWQLQCFPGSELTPEVPLNLVLCAMGTVLTSQRVAQSPDPDPVPASALCFVWAWGQNQEQVVLCICLKVVWASRVSKALLTALRLGLDSQCLTCRSQLPFQDCVAQSGQGNPRSLSEGPL